MLFDAAHAATPPIVNGAQTDDYAHVLLLRHTTSDGQIAFVCTGTLVTPDIVLTAAHCLTEAEGYDLTQVRVSSGSVWTDEVPERRAADWLVHPDYSVSADGLEIVADLGLVYLDEPYTLDGAVLGTTALTQGDVGVDLRYVGWGASSDSANDQGYYKRVADIPLVGFEGEFLLAYEEGGAATCGGDSGAPVFLVDEGRAGSLVGVHSFGRDDDGTLCEGSTSGATRVAGYLDWILAEAPEARTDAVERVAEEPSEGGCSSTPGGRRLAPFGALAALALRRRRP